MQGIDRPAEPGLRIGLLLLPGFSLEALSSLVDRLRSVQHVDATGTSPCRWAVMAEAGQDLRSGSGVAVRPDQGLSEPDAWDCLVLLGSPAAAPESALQQYLQAAARAGVRIAVMGCGGQLPGYACSSVDALLAQLPQQSGASRWPVRTHNRHVRKAMLLMERNLATPVTAEFVARQVGLSLRQLQRLFMQELGLSPASYAQQLRMDFAHSRLLHSGDTVSHIALQAGYVNQSHFSRTFKAHFGLSPRAMRGLDERVA